jgi:hypothetical protein
MEPEGSLPSLQELSTCTYAEPKRIHALLTFGIAYNIWGFHGGDYEKCRLLGCDAIWLHSVVQLPVTTYVAFRSLIPFTLMMEAIHPSETSVLTRATQKTAIVMVITYFSTSIRVGSWYIVRFEAFTAVTMKNGVLWVVTPCGSCKNRRFGGTWRLLHQISRVKGISSQRTSVASCILCCY